MSGFDTLPEQFVLLSKVTLLKSSSDVLLEMLLTSFKSVSIIAWLEISSITDWFEFVFISASLEISPWIPWFESPSTTAWCESSSMIS